VKPGLARAASKKTAPASPPRSVSPAAATKSDDPLHALYGRPGFLIRRAHQIAVSLFVDEMGALGVTPTQSGILFVLGHRSALDQISVARLLGLDRSTASMVIAKLVAAGLVARGVGSVDRRRRALTLTPAGQKMLECLTAPMDRARARVLSPFDAEEAAQFLILLEKFTKAFNGTTRVPMMQERIDPES
jgi:MarR family transcriptional regulator, lower aerobic nicotinate degradation pathway regulator